MNKLPRKQIFDVTGEDQKNDNGTYRQMILRDCLPGEAVTLERQTSNPHDRNAILVRHMETGEGLGYISRTENSELAAALDNGVSNKSRLHELRGGFEDFPNFGCRVCVVAPEKPFRDTVPLKPEQIYYEHAPSWRRSSKGSRSKGHKPSGGVISKLLGSLFK